MRKKEDVKSLITNITYKKVYGTENGEWKNEEKGKRYYGFFQGYISAGSHRVSIKWMGVETGGVHCGDCLWVKR